MGQVKLGQHQVKLGRIKSGQVNSRQFKLGQVKICNGDICHLSRFTVYCHTRLNLGFSAKLKIWQVPACKMESQRGIILN